jgi:hypothetical protein
VNTLIPGTKATSSWQFEPGGGGGDLRVSGGVLFTGAAGIWPVIDLFGLSAALGVVAGVFFLFAMLLYSVANNLHFKRRGLIKFTLLTAVLLAATLDPIVFHLQLARFVVVDWLVLLFYLAALLLGLWTVLLNVLKFFAAAVAVTLLIAPFTPVAEKEKWKVTLEVVDEGCAPMPQTPAACRALTGERLGDAVSVEDGVGLTDEKGKREFEFSGNPLLKGAICYAFRPSLAGSPAYRLRSAIVPAPLIAGAHARIRLYPNGLEHEASPSSCSTRAEARDP